MVCVSVCVARYVPSKIYIMSKPPSPQMMRSTCSRLLYPWTLRPTEGKTWPFMPRAPWPTFSTGSKSRTTWPTSWPTPRVWNPTLTAPPRHPRPRDTRTPSPRHFSVSASSCCSCLDDCAHTHTHKHTHTLSVSHARLNVGVFLYKKVLLHNQLWNGSSSVSFISNWWMNSRWLRSVSG